MVSSNRQHSPIYTSIIRSAAWRRVRRAVVEREQGMCELCRRNGIEREGRDVHHLIPILQDPSRAYDPQNLVLLCKACHREVEGR